MSAKLLDGKTLAAKIKKSLAAEIQSLKAKTGLVPTVVNVMLGDDHGACAYARSQEKAAKDIGLDYQLEVVPLTISQDELIERVKQFSKNPEIHGVMLHKPVPAHIDYRTVANFVDTDKDLEGINIANIGKMVLGHTDMIPCTPAAVMAHIHSTGVGLKGKESVIVGHSEIVGKPLSLLLLRELATVTVCHVETSRAGMLPGHVGRADILVVAVGRSGLIKGSWIKPGAIVIDVGINQVQGKITGDVEFEVAREKASYITPVPGGVGPVTAVMLMKNAVEAFKAQTKK